MELSTNVVLNQYTVVYKMWKCGQFSVIPSSPSLDNVPVQPYLSSEVDTVCLLLRTKILLSYNIQSTPKPQQKTWITKFFIPKGKECYVFTSPEDGIPELQKNDFNLHSVLFCFILQCMFFNVWCCSCAFNKCVKKNLCHLYRSKHEILY